MKEKDAQNGPEKPTFKIRVKERKLGRHKAMGLAHPDGLIEIDPRTPPKEYLDTLIHELLHQARPSSYWDEEAVWETAAILAEHLWKAGFRKVDLGCPEELAEKKTKP